MTTFEQDILNCKDLDECAERLTAVIRIHLDCMAQVENFQVKKKFCAWVDNVAKRTILRKQKLHAIWKNTGTKEDYEKFRDVSNFLTWDLKKKKKVYIEHRLRSTVGLHDMWESAKAQVGWKTASGPTSLSVNGELTSKNCKMAQSQKEFLLNTQGSS